MKQLPEEEQKKWIKAAEEAMNSHKENKTWTLCDLPEDNKAIDCKWVCKLKHDAEGNVDRHKTRLVARGFTEKFGGDYDDTFAPVARHTTLRTLLTVAASRKLQVRHYDVKTAFLNGDIDEELYMKLQKVLSNPENKEKCVKYRKRYMD